MSLTPSPPKRPSYELVLSNSTYIQKTTALTAAQTQMCDAGDRTGESPEIQPAVVAATGKANDAFDAVHRRLLPFAVGTYPASMIIEADRPIAILKDRD